jgi:hypothetical protein
MAQDEGCFGRISRPQRGFAPPGIRPSAPAQVVREYLDVYAAVAPQKGLLTSLILPEASTAMMNLFLEHVSHTFSQYFIVMQVDQAGWHHAHDLVIPENIRLIEQPPSSSLSERTDEQSCQPLRKRVCRSRRGQVRQNKVRSQAEAGRRERPNGLEGGHHPGATPWIGYGSA